MLSQAFFQNNRRTLRELVNNELIIMTAHGLVQRSADTTYPFRQESNFFYLTGVSQPDVILVICGTEEFLVKPKQSKPEIVFGGAIDDIALRDQSGIRQILSYEVGVAKIKLLLRNGVRIHSVMPPPSKIKHADNFYTNPSRRQLLVKLKRWQPGIDFIDLRIHMTKMRQIKQPEEITAIQQAIDSTAEGFISAKLALKDGIKEYELQSIFDQQFRLKNMGHGYEPIVAGAENACTLHYIKNSSVLTKRQLVLIDAGAEYSNYSADVSRTYPVESGSISKRQEAVVAAVKMIQEQLIDYLRPGVTWKQYDTLATELTNKELVKLGLIKNIADKKGLSYFPHSVGHSLGLDVHDVSDYTSLQENMIVTCEPGIYITEEGLGVRIEDDILITKDGAVNLSEKIPY
jgi:Xaa-Pro aminopeptidase